MNLAFFASYNGSSAHAITNSCLEEGLNASPTLMLSNNPEANALEWAEKKGLKTYCINKSTHEDPSLRDAEIAKLIQNNRISMIVLSGYMQLIGDDTINAVQGRIINIHPSLLPKYGGKGMFGRNVHEAVKENNETETGITIHQVTDKYDDGKILAQKHISLTPSMTVDDIEQTVRNAEPEFYVETLRKVLKREIELN